MTDWHLAHFAQHLPEGDYSQLLPPTGADWRTRVIIPMNNGIVALRVTDNDRTYWYLPGGGTGPVETLPACAIRETHEETGLLVEPQRLLYIRDFKDTIEFFILARYVTGTLQTGYNPEPDALPIEKVAVLSFDTLEQDDNLIFYPVHLRQRLQHDIKNPPTSAIYLGNMA